MLHLLRSAAWWSLRYIGMTVPIAHCAQMRGFVGGWRSETCWDRVLYHRSTSWAHGNCKYTAHANTCSNIVILPSTAIHAPLHAVKESSHAHVALGMRNGARSTCTDSSGRAMAAGIAFSWGHAVQQTPAPTTPCAQPASLMKTPATFAESGDATAGGNSARRSSPAPIWAPDSWGVSSGSSGSCGGPVREHSMWEAVA